MIEISKLSGRLGNQMFRHAYLYSQVRNGIIPDVYVQDYKYFDKYREEIKSLFGEGIGFLDYVGIHVRRGDYVNNPFYVNLADDTDYYERAVAMFPNEKFLVFSDDPEYAKKKFPDETKFQIMEGADELEDLNMLGSCKHIIMANSSFSWWSSYLCPNWGKTIIAPKAWHPDQITRTHLPEEWKQI